MDFENIELETVEVRTEIDLENWVLVTLPATIGLTDINAVLDEEVIVLKWSTREVRGSIFECLFVTTPEVVEFPIYFEFETTKDVDTLDVSVLIVSLGFIKLLVAFFTDALFVKVCWSCTCLREVETSLLSVADLVLEVTSKVTLVVPAKTVRVVVAGLVSNK